MCQQMRLSPFSSSSSTLFTLTSGLSVQAKVSSQDRNINLFVRTLVFGGKNWVMMPASLAGICDHKNTMIKKIFRQDLKNC